VGMPLEELLRGYTAGNTVISRFVAEECIGLPPEALTYSVEVQSRVADALIGGLSTEYARQAALLAHSTHHRTSHEMERLLAGEPFSADAIDYRLDGWHVAGIVSGVKAKQAATVVTERIGCNLLLLPRTAETYWAWWGSRDRSRLRRLEPAAQRLGEEAWFALGKCREGPEGVRLSHREAHFAAEIAVRRGAGAGVVRGAEAILPGLLLRDGDAALLFVDAHLGTLKPQKDWPTIAATIEAYLDAECAPGIAAAALGVDRHTIRRRLQRIEKLMEQPMTAVRAELEIALRMDRLLTEDPRSPRRR
jgi:sugar diacid utilization regulator